jgi:hypothetical protein
MHDMIFSLLSLSHSYRALKQWLLGTSINLHSAFTSSNLHSAFNELENQTMEPEFCQIHCTVS